MTYHNVEEILRQKDITYEVKSNGYLARCFNPEHQDNNPSMHISSEGLYYCFSCGYKGNLLKEERLYSSDIALKKKKLLDLMNTLENKDLNIPISATPFTSFFRGISGSTYRKFEAFTYNGKLYNVDMTNRIVFPIRSSSGSIKVFQGRLMSGEDYKYMNAPKGVGLPMFPTDKVRGDTVYLVEGLFDMLNLTELGLSNVISIFGTNTINKNTEELSALKLKGVRHIGLMLDNDEAGNRATEALFKSKALSGFELFEVEYNASDPGNLTELPSSLKTGG